MIRKPAHPIGTFDPRTTTVGHGEPAHSFRAAFRTTLKQPLLAPAGANDWERKLTTEHPIPVILVHGTWENAYNNWAALAPALADDGFNVFALNYGENNLFGKGGIGSLLPNAFGLTSIEESARELAIYVNEVLATTGAKQVDLVGHSQGGLVIRYYVKNEGGADPTNPENNKARKIITLGATNSGTTMALRPAKKPAGEDLLNTRSTPHAVDASFITSMQNVPIWKNFAAWFAGASAVQQQVGSDFINKLNRGGQTMPGIEYTAIGTRYDQITTPYESTFMTAGTNASVNNLLLQDGCPTDHSDHLAMSYSPRAIDMVRHALDPRLAPPETWRCAPVKPAL